MSTEAVLIFASFAGIEGVLRILGWLVDPRKIHGAFALRRFSILPAIGAAGVIGLSFVDTSALVGHPTPARMAAGSLICLLGLLIRYPLAMLGLLARRLKLEWERLRWVSEILPMRHPRYLGLAAEVAGLSAILGSPLGVAAVGFVLIPAILLAANLEEKWVLANYPGSSVDSDRRRRSLLRPPVLTAALLLVPPALLYLTVAFSTRELVLFNSGEETARTLLLSMAGAQGTWAILALSLILVLMQVVTSNYSANLAQLAGLRWPLLAALAFLAASVLYDVIVVARIDDWVVGHRDRGGALVDLGLMWSGLSLATVAVAAFESTSHVKAERLMERLLRRLDTKWLESVTQDWPSRFGPRELRMDDPMRAVEIVLRSLLNRGDLASTRIALAQLRDALRAAIWPECRDDARLWVSLDSYLHYYSRSLIEATAKQMDEAAINEWMGFVRFMMEYSAVDDAVFKSDSFHPWDDYPPGESLLRRVTSAAVSNAHLETAIQGILMVRSRADKLIGILPADADALVFGGQLTALRDMPEEEQERKRQNDYLVESFQRHYVNYLREQGEQAIGTRQGDLAFQTSLSLCELLGQVLRLRKESAKIRRSLVGDILYELERMADAVCKSQTSGAFTVSTLALSLDRLDFDDDDDREILSGIGVWTGRIVTKLARDGMLDYRTAVDTAMVGLGVQRLGAADNGEVFASFVNALDLLLENLTGGRDEKHPLVIQELLGRIRQLAPSAKGEVAELAKSRISNLEQRYEQWQTSR